MSICKPPQRIIFHRRTRARRFITNVCSMSSINRDRFRYVTYLFFFPCQGDPRRFHHCYRKCLSYYIVIIAVREHGSYFLRVLTAIRIIIVLMRNKIKIHRLGYVVIVVFRLAFVFRRLTCTRNVNLTNLGSDVYAVA